MNKKKDLFLRKVFFYFILIIPCCSFSEDIEKFLDYWKTIIEGQGYIDSSNGKDWMLSNKVKTFNEFEGKKILSFIRGGDYTHVGEEEALDVIMNLFCVDKNRKILDVACGLGGSAHYFQQHEWGTVTGFDIDNAAIEYAQCQYPSSHFFVADVSNISTMINDPDFDIICIVNSFVCFPDQLLALKELRKLAKPTTKLVIFEYTDLITNGVNVLQGKGLNGSFFPIKIDEFQSMFNEAGWELSTYQELDKSFTIWYEKFLSLVESKREDIDNKFGKNTTNYVLGKYTTLYYACKNNWLGGCLMTFVPKNKE